MTSLAISGNHIGSVIANVLSGTLSETYGWPVAFYGFGVAAIIWSFIWLLVVRKSPEDDRLITAEEKNYIKDNCEETSEKLVVPWKDLLTSPAVWAIASAHSAFNWGFYTFLTQLPSYLKGSFILIVH